MHRGQGNDRKQTQYTCVYIYDSIDKNSTIQKHVTKQNFLLIGPKQ